MEDGRQIVEHIIHSEGVENLRPLKVEIERNSRGYNFSIGYRGETIEEVTHMVEETAHEMRAMIRRLGELEKEEE